MRTRLRHRIQARVSILVVAGMLGPLAVIAALGAGASRELERRMLAGRTQTASLVAERLQTQLSLEREGLRAAAEQGGSSTALREAWVQRRALFDAMFAVDADGNVTSQEPAPGVSVDGPLALKLAHAGFTDLLPSGVAWALVARPGGGVVGGVIDPRSTRFAGVLRGYRSVAGESIDLLDGHGVVLASSDPARLLARPQAAEEELVASAKVPLARWEIVVRQPRTEALGLFVDLSRNALIACVLAVAVALAFAWGAARSLTRPLSLLTAAAERISEGDLQHPIPKLDEDEVGILGDALEHMRSRLQDSVARKLLAQVIRAQEEERVRVARELHDETTQQLATLNLKLQSGDVQAASALAVQTLDGVHRLIADLRPSVLDDLGLKSAILWYAERRLKPLGIKVRCEFSGLDVRLPPQLETVVFRVVQEALNNVARHAHASSVLVQCGLASGRIVAEVEDDGQGFEPAKQNGWGLMGMRERVEMLGGELRLDSAPGEGTHVWLSVPVVEAANLEVAHVH